MQIDDSGHISLLDVGSSNVDRLPLLTPHDPQDFPLNTSNTIVLGIDWGAVVAPYWYDVDTTSNGSGRIYYKDVTRGTDADLIEEIDSLATPRLCGFTTIWALIVTWDQVGYYSERSDKVQGHVIGIVYIHTYLHAISCIVSSVITHLSGLYIQYICMYTWLLGAYIRILSVPKHNMLHLIYGILLMA